MIPPFRNTFLEAILDLETTIDNIFDWFYCNNFKVNPFKYHLFLSPFNIKSINFKIFLQKEKIFSEKLLTVVINLRYILMSYVKKVIRKFMAYIDVVNP